MSNEIRQLEVGKVYTFDTYAPEVLGTHIINVKCLAIFNAENAISNGLDIYSYHERMRAHLPVGYNNDPTTMVYVKLKNTSGRESIFAMDWINLSTISETKANRIVVTMNDVSLEDVEVIRKALVAQGYTDINIVLTEQ